MNWTIEWLYAVAITSLTGSILMLVWSLVGWWLERRGYVNVTFELLKVVMAFFFLPISFVVLKIREWKGSVGDGTLFLQTPTLIQVSRILFVTWCAIATLLLLFMVRDLYLLHKKKRDLFPCTNAMKVIFEEIYGESVGEKRKRKLEIYMSYRFSVPCVIGILHPKVILPVKEYASDELKVIFTHEITHFLQGDVALKLVGTIMLGLHFFNPFAWWFVWSIQKWSEYACDFKACNRLSSMKYYFNVIMDIAAEKPERYLLSSQLTEGRNELKERIEKMKRVRNSSKVKQLSRLSAMILGGIVFATSALTVYAATVSSVEQYEYLYRLTKEGAEDVKEAQEEEISVYEEFIETGSKEGISESIGEVNEYSRSIAGFVWTIEDMKLQKTKTFSCEAGDTISISVLVKPDDVTIKVGIIEPNGYCRYINVTEYASHNFTVNSSGKYRVYAENATGQTVDVEGCYIIY